MSTKKYIWYLVKCFSLLMVSNTQFNCKSKQAELEKKHPIPNVNGFNSFYELFHTDSLYQVQHTQFPLAGMPEQNDTTQYANGFKWQKQNWIMHRSFNEKDSLFRREYAYLDSTLIIENIYHLLSPMRMERRFSYNTEWQLIYYSPMRVPIKVEIN